MENPYARHAELVRSLKRRKIGDRKYAIIDRTTGQQVGEAAMTGEYSRDDYPWEGDSIHGVTGSQDSLRAVIEKIATQMLNAELAAEAAAKEVSS